MIYDQTITALRPAFVTDRYSNQIPDWSVATRSVVGGVSVQPATQQEPGADNRTLVITGWRVFTSDGVDIDLLPTDRIELASGEMCEVDGKVARWPALDGPGVDHCEFALRRVEG